MRYVLSCLLVVSYFLFPRYSYVWADGDLCNHFLYSFSHVNIFHLGVNILCLMLLRCPLRFFESYLCCVFSSFLPSWSGDTCGFSGYLFAMVGISWGRIGLFRRMIEKNVWYLVIPLFIPGVNGLLHLYCLLLGYFVGYGSRDK
jgi:hypothetical protein